MDEQHPSSPLISIIIPTYNAGKHLAACLQSIVSQNYPVEIIVVDQESVDETREIAEQYKALVISLPKPAFYSPPSPSRNRGAREAHGSILYHLDSDMELEQGLLQEIAQRFTDAQLGALVVHEKDKPIGFWSKCKAFERECYWGNDKIESARVVRTSLFKEVQGYDESIFSGEDFNIHRRYKEKALIGFCDKVVFHNIGYLSFFKLLKKKFNYGKTASVYSTKHEEHGVGVLLEEVQCYIKHYKDFLAHPILGAGALFLKGCEFASGALGLLLVKLR